MTDNSYAGDVMPRAAWAALEEDSQAVLIDVRTKAEWSFVGTPRLPEGKAMKGPVLIEWQHFPSMEINDHFLDQLNRSLSGFSPPKAQLFFLCRSGSRSKSAAIAATRAGWATAYNVQHGFEGDPDRNGQRGQVNGWKADGLPWAQT
jgi:rhodanese-related sulfurtransferase